MKSIKVPSSGNDNSCELIASKPQLDQRFSRDLLRFVEL